MHIKHRDFSRLTKISLIYIRIKWIQFNTTLSFFLITCISYNVDDNLKSPSLCPINYYINE